MKQRNRGVSAQLNSSHSSATQPVGQSRNVRRMQQIESLHSEFQDLKKKIKDVQNKNQKIIENIHRRYDFKKKPATTQYMNEQLPIVYYQQPQMETRMQNQSVNSNQSECQFQIGRPVDKKTSNIRKNVNNMHQSMEYRKTEHNLERESEIGSKHNYNMNMNKQVSMGPSYYPYGTQSQVKAQNSVSQQFGAGQYPNMPFQMSMQFPPYPSMAYSQVDNTYGTGSHQLESAIRKQKDRVKILEQQLEQKEQDSISLKRLQKKYRNMAVQYSDSTQQMLEQFMQKVVERRFAQISKHVKNTQNKLRKLQLVIKDKDEQYRSIRNISEHQNRRRSRSRNKQRDSSPMATPTNYNSLPKAPTRKNIVTQPQLQSGDSHSASKSKQSDHSKSSIQFEQIATKYQDMIKTKSKELDKSEISLKRKEKQLVQMNAKCASLELKLAEYQEIPKKINKFASVQKEDNLLANLDFQSQKDGQIKILNRTIAQFQAKIREKQIQIKEKDANALRMNKKITQLELKYKKSDIDIKKLKQQLRKVQDLGKDDNELQLKLKRLENELKSREKEYSLTKQKCVRIQNQKIERDCQNMTLSNRLKKIQQLLTVKEQKISELEKIIQSNNGNEFPDLLEKSVIIEKTEHHDLHGLQEDKQKLEEELTKKEEQNFILRKNNQNLMGKSNEMQAQTGNLMKQVETLMLQNENMKLNMKALQFQKYSVKSESHKSPLQNLLEQNQCLSQNDDNSTVREELDELRSKYEQTQRQLKAQKHQSLEFNTKLIKMNSQLSYYRQTLTSREQKYQKLKKEYEEGRCQINQLQQQVQARDNQLEHQKKLNTQKIMELQTQWMQFQQEIRNKDQLQNTVNNISDMRSSRNFSEESFVGYKNTFNSMNAQNEHLTQKLKESQKIIQIQKEMQNKIMNQYRNNVDKIKTQLRDKVKNNEQMIQETEILRRRVKVMQQNQIRLRNMAQRGDKDGIVQTNQRIYALQMQLAELRQIKDKQEAVEQQLFKQIAQKQQDNQSLMRLISSKQKVIEELHDIIELKEMNVNFSSHISSSQNKSKVKDSMQSNSSLKYSMLSNNPNKTIDLELSEAGESFFQQNQSIISNVSEVFGREEFPYEKMQLRRVEQRRLFQKTAAYIKSLKKAIDQKSKKIKLLQKKIQSLRNSQLIRKDLYQVKQMFDVQPEADQFFNDCYSVQNVRTSTQRYKFKQLEHETKLTIEENYLLNNQIESMQDELMKAEEQENSLMKLKDLYKDEIKSLIKKNQEQAKTFEDEMKRERQKVEQSQSVQRMQALKQLYVKIMAVIAALEKDGHKSKKREQHKKQLQQYSKIYCNFLNVQQSVRDKILSQIRR